MTRYNKITRTMSLQCKVDDYFEVEVDLADFISEIDDDDLLAEVGERKLLFSDEAGDSKFEISRDILCDYYCISRFTDVDKIIELVKKSIL